MLHTWGTLVTKLKSRCKNIEQLFSALSKKGVLAPRPTVPHHNPPLLSYLKRWERLHQTIVILKLKVFQKKTERKMFFGVFGAEHFLCFLGKKNAIFAKLHVS